MSSIPGLEHLAKEGWEIVRFDYASQGEWFVDSEGRVIQCRFPGGTDEKKIIIRKIEKPKAYRAFANAAEFKPHRDRWVRRIANGGAFLVSDYSEEGFCYDELNPVSWEELFNMGYVFDDDGTPFGVEVAS